MKIIFLKILSFIVFMTSSLSAAAQYTLFEHPVNEKYIEIYFSKPILEEDTPEFEFISNIGVISTQLHCDARKCFGVEIPYSYASISDSNLSYIANDDKFTVGNPHLFLKNQLSVNSFLNFSLTLPNVSQLDGFAPAYGVITRFDQMEMFFPELTTFNFGGMYIKRNSRVQPFVKFGFTVWYFDGQAVDDDQTEFLNRYAFGFNINNKDVLITTKLKGMTILSESELNFNDRNINFFTFAVKHKSKFQPGIYFMTPLDEDLEPLKYTVGIGIGTTF